jgi:methionine sulfoxide reductase heme-binding subunit
MSTPWRWLQTSGLQVAAHLGAWLPLSHLLFDFFTDRLTVNPIQDITLRTGKAALVLLVLSLACTPLNSLFGWRQALKLRRPLGVYGALYVTLHFLIFVGLDYGFDLELIYGAIFEKRFALVGFAAFLLLLPLLVTSTRGWQRRLGKRWKRLHRLTYLAVPLAIIHYVWSVKSDVREPLAYGAIVVALLVVRLRPVKRALRRAGTLLVALGWEQGRQPAAGIRRPQHNAAAPTPPAPRLDPGPKQTTPDAD